MLRVADIQRIVRDMTRPLRRQANMMIARAVVDAVNDGTKFQGLRLLVLSDEMLDEVEHMQPGGLTHSPLAGAECVVLSVGGHRDHPVAVGVSNRDARPKNLEAGETALYSVGTNGGLKIKLLADGGIELTPVGIPLGKVRIVGNLEATGEVSAMAGTPGQVKLSAHLHTAAPGGGPTSPPIPSP